jgi:hypothetical protein
MVWHVNKDNSPSETRFAGDIEGGERRGGGHEPFRTSQEGNEPAVLGPSWSTAESHDPFGRWLREDEREGPWSRFELADGELNDEISIGEDGGEF